MIMKSIRQPEKSKNLLRSLLSAYKTREIDTIYKLTMAEDDMADYHYKKLILEDRNRKWLPLITSQAEWTPTFFAVGAAHLGGPAGLISLLRKEGYTVTPIPM